MSDIQDSSWKLVPCHFVWDLETGIHVDFQGLVNNLDSKLETRRDSQWTDSACDMLLFRGYLEVSKFAGAECDPRKAEEFFLEAEREAMEVTNDEERRSYITVATANRLWVLETIDKDRETAKDQRKELLQTLEQSWGNYADERERERMQAYIDTVAAFALSRLGLNKCGESETRYQRAIKTLGQSAKSSWYHTLGLMIGRQARQGCNDGAHAEINDEIRCYEKALEIDPTNDSARCDLARILSRDLQRVTEARELIEEAEGTNSEIIIKKARFYRSLKDYGKTLEILKKGEQLLQRPRSELFYQFALVYKDLAKKDSGRRKEYNQLKFSYLDKCLQLEPMHFWALIDKAYAFGERRMNSQADSLLRRVIEDFRSNPFNLIQAQFKYAAFLVHSNSYHMNEASARAYEAVVDTAISILSTDDGEDKGTVRRVLLPKSKERLTDYYHTSPDGTSKLENLERKLSEIVF